MVLGDRLLSMDMRSGVQIDETARPPGRWIDGTVVPANGATEDREPRLITLTVDSGVTVISALRVSSGTRDVLWQGVGFEPAGLLAVGSSLLMVHSQGVVRIDEEAE
jgi:hypothetical protein